jgi:hypothetical protein
MATLTETEVGKEVARANEIFQPKDGSCAATPRAMQMLLERLQTYTEEVQAEADSNGIDSDKNVAQWAKDMSNWQRRLGDYQQIVEAVPEEQQDTAEGCMAIYTTVTAPLLDGIFYTQAPGIVLNQEEVDRIRSGAGHPGTDVTTRAHEAGHSNAKPPDVATPFSLGNQVLVYKEWQAERWRLFWDDLIKSAEDVFGGLGSIFTPWTWPTWVKITVAAAGAAAIGTGTYLAIRKIRRPKKNPGRRSGRRPKPQASTRPQRPHLEIVR